MKNLSVFVLLFVVGLFQSQNTRFIYQVSMKLDSTNRNDVKTELAYLDVSPEKSLFYSEKRMKRDSLFSKMRQTGSFNFDRSQMENYRSDIDYEIEKNLVSPKTTFKVRIARDQYAYDEDRPMDWKILPETVKIGEYKTQKAETQFGGRKWFAWFAQEVPFQDGPYKFRGLPGLIIKVEDSKGDYSFDLKESKKIAEIASFESRGTLIKVKKADYDKQYAVYKKDPISFMQNSMNSGGGGNGIRSPERSNDNPNQRKEMENRLKQEILKNNNPIELK